MNINTTTPNTHSGSDGIEEMQGALIELQKTLLVNRKRTRGEESSNTPSSTCVSPNSTSPLTKKPRSDRSQ